MTGKAAGHAVNTKLTMSAKVTTRPTANERLNAVGIRLGVESVRTQESACCMRVIAGRDMGKAGRSTGPLLLIPYICSENAVLNLRASVVDSHTEN